MGTPDNRTSNATLFPAYSNFSNENPAQFSEGNKDWLCNNSYNADHYKEPTHHQYQESATETSESLKETEKTEAKYSKRKSLKREKPVSKKLPEQVSYLRSQLNKLTFIEETGLSYERAYHTDAKCDAENTLFDCFERKKIAKYKLKFLLPFGLSLKEQTSWPRDPEKKPKKTLRYFSKKGLKLVDKLETDIVKIASLPSNLVSDFLPVSMESSLENKLSSKIFYGVSLEWKVDSFKKPKPDEENKCHTLYSELDIELKEKTIYFNKKLAETPHDIKLWQDFINFQDEILMSQSTSNSNVVTESSVIDKKIAILEKAISLNPSSVDLIVTKLNLCKNSWELKELTASWENLLFLNPHNPIVWQQYLAFILTNLKYFSYQRVLKIYAKCIKTLSNVSEGVLKSHKPPKDIVHSMIEIFSTFCFVLHSCGYTERAIASYQALIELNFFAPSTIQSLLVQEQVSLFEPFWDSGALRFGEDGAIGWASTINEEKIVSEKIVSESDLNYFEDEILSNKLSLSQTWCQFERLREFHHWLPWRPNPTYDQTSDDIDDLDRTISFDDVSSILFRISDEKEKVFLILKFLNFLDFNIHDQSCTDQAYKKFHSQLHLDKDFLLNQLNETIFKKHEKNPFSFKQMPFSNEKVSLMKNIFSQSLESFSPEYRTILSQVWIKCQKYCAFASIDEASFKQSMDNSKEFAKSILQKPENRNNLLLWLEYIEIEEICSSKSKAKKTFEKLLKSSSTAVLNGTMKYENLWHLVRSYIEWGIGIIQFNKKIKPVKISNDEIIWLLLQIGCKEIYEPCSTPDNKPALILKASREFEALLHQHLASFVNENFVYCPCLDPSAYAVLDCLMCFAYFNYLTKGIDSALSVLSESSKMLDLKLTGSKKSLVKEHLSVLQARLLNFHTWNTTASLKPLQLFLYDAIQEFPFNSELLLLLVKLRCASSVVSPTRRFFSRLLKNQQHLPVTWIFAIASELSIVYSLLEFCEEENTQNVSVSSLGIHWKIRALYERALTSQLCFQCPNIWRSYIKFEIQNGDSIRAKNIYHRAVQCCVWSKEMHVDAIEYFPEDLNQIIELMNEKQIRVHTPLEEVSLLMEHAL